MQMFLFIMSLLFSSVYCLTSHIDDCLISGMVWHNSSSACVPLLEQGPCSIGQHVVLGPQFEGICQAHKKCKEGEIEIISTNFTITCGCPDGEIKQDAKCQNLFTQGSCSSGYVLIAKESETLLCPENFDCVESLKCKSYQLAKKVFVEASDSSKIILKNHLKQLVCTKEGMKICCPQSNSNSLLSPANVVGSFLWKEPEAECVLDNQDAQKLFQGDSIGPVLSEMLAMKRNCGRRRAWSPYSRRCMKIYR